MCKIMNELNRIMKHLGKRHNVEFSHDDVEMLRCLLCSYVCGGKCQPYLIQKGESDDR